MASEALKFLRMRIPNYAGNGSVPIEHADLSDLGYRWQTGDLPHSISGRLDPENRLITINSFDQSDRRRFTLAHELGHLIQLFSMRARRVFACQLQEPLGDETPVEYMKLETEADWFAANLIMPTGPLFKFLADSIEVFPSEDYLVRKVSEYFDVSRSAALRRLQSLYPALTSPGYLRLNDL